MCFTSNRRTALRLQCHCNTDVHVGKGQDAGSAHSCGTQVPCGTNVAVGAPGMGPPVLQGCSCTTQACLKTPLLHYLKVSPGDLLKCTHATVALLDCTGAIAHSRLCQADLSPAVQSANASITRCCHQTTRTLQVQARSMVTPESNRTVQPVRQLLKLGCCVCSISFQAPSLSGCILPSSHRRLLTP